MLSILYYLGWNNSANMKTEIPAQMLVEKVGPVKARQIFPININPETPLSFSSGETRQDRQKLEFTGIDFAGEANLMALLAESSFLEVGSNNWAIAPDRTIMGGAIMCNDPHLITSKIPGPMYPFGLVTPEFRAVGCCIPGIPGIIIGRTGVMPGFTNKKIVTMRWSPFETMQSVTGLENLVMCKTVGEVRKELGKITIAMLKFVFADSNGGIAWQTTGRLPVRSQGESIVPYDAELLVFLAEQDRIHGA